LQRLSIDFGVNEDLSKFTRKNEGNFLRLISKDKRMGYVFAGELQLDRDYKTRILSEEAFFNSKNLKVNYLFIDNNEGLSGFSWSNKA